MSQALLLVSVLGSDILHCGMSIDSHVFRGPPHLGVKQATPFQTPGAFVPKEPTHVGYVVFDIRGQRRQHGDIIISIAKHADNTSLLTACTLITEAHDALPPNAYMLDFNLFFAKNLYCEHADDWPHCASTIEFSMDLFADPQLVFLKPAGSGDWLPINAVNASGIVLSDERDMFYQYNDQSHIWAETKTQIVDFDANQERAFLLEIDTGDCVYPRQISGFQGTLSQISYMTHSAVGPERVDTDCLTATVEGVTVTEPTVTEPTATVTGPTVSLNDCSNFCMEPGVQYLLTLNLAQRWTLVGPKFTGGANRILDITKINTPTQVLLGPDEGLEDVLTDIGPGVYVSAVQGDRKYYLRNPGDIDLDDADTGTTFMAFTEETRLYIDPKSIAGSYLESKSTPPASRTRVALYGYIDNCLYVDAKDEDQGVQLSALDGAAIAFWSQPIKACADTFLEASLNLDAPILRPYFYGFGGLVTGFFETIQFLELEVMGRAPQTVPFDDMVALSRDICTRMVPLYPERAVLLNPDLRQMSDGCFGTAKPDPKTLRLELVENGYDGRYTPCSYLRGTAFGHIDIIYSLLKFECSAIPLLLIAGAAVCYTLLVQTWADVHERRGMRNAGRLGMKLIAEKKMQIDLITRDDWIKTFKKLDGYTKTPKGWSDDNAALKTNHGYCVRLVGWEGSGDEAPRMAL